TRLFDPCGRIDSRTCAIELGERRQKTALLLSPNHQPVLFRMQWQSSSISQVRRLKSCSFCTCAKLQNNCFEICTCKNKELKTYCNQHLQKNRARGGSHGLCHRGRRPVSESCLVPMRQRVM